MGASRLNAPGPMEGADAQMDELGLWPAPMSPEEARGKNPLALAFMGDTIWDLLVRQELLRTSLRVNDLNRNASARVNAGAQAKAFNRVEPALTEDERDVARRGFNAHCKHVVPKNQDPVDYRRATGLEALIGYLYLTGQMQRIRALFRLAEEEREMS